MALVSQGFRGTITLADNEGSRSTLRYDLVAANAADALAAMGVIAAALNPITDAVIAGYTVSEVFEEDALVLPGDGVEIEKQAVISNRIDTSSEKWAVLRIPAPNVGIFAAASGSQAGVIDPADAALGTYLSVFGAAGQATISDGETLLAPSVANTKGKKAHRASKNG